MKPLSGTFEYAIHEDLFSVNPVKQLKARDYTRQHEYQEAYEWTTEEIERFLSAARSRAEAGTSRYDYYPLLHTAVRTGLRLGELLGLQWGDVRLADNPEIRGRSSVDAPG